MTTQELMNEYGIEFTNKIIKMDKRESVTYKSPNADNELLAEFLCYWDDERDLDEIIPKIEEVIRENLEDYGISGSRIGVMVGNVNSRMFIDVEATPRFILPTHHFLAILILWRDFLLAEPLSGKRIKKWWNRV